MTDEEALDQQQTVEITTIGRRSGQPRRIETWRYRGAGAFWLSGSPGARDWYANLLADPGFTVHLKDRDLRVRARVVTDPDERVRVLTAIWPEQAWAGTLASWIAGSPLVEIQLQPRFLSPDSLPVRS
ncbi:nitroreductase family deazaflavin-dependent oxidoreductase [Actinoplanes sp. N902-109]|uniref:nitroreductase family deazaflavin-dependent oxidoreductase n=1 Tax=Actinoplanes sp. (strain N902-109) TaxID=649831 RepID=UPI0003A8E903|nr:nitroreductase family deazaflavin-dependent oxidoreductase [Actinoplanes sp. N902-109]